MDQAYHTCESVTTTLQLRDAAALLVRNMSKTRVAVACAASDSGCAWTGSTVELQAVTWRSACPCIHLNAMQGQNHVAQSYMQWELCTQQCMGQQ